MTLYLSSCAPVILVRTSNDRGIALVAHVENGLRHSTTSQQASPGRLPNGDMHGMQSGATSLNHRDIGPEALASDELARAAIEARTVLEAAANAAAEAAEQALTVAAALDAALAQLDDHADRDHDQEAASGRTNSAAAPVTPLSALSPREHEVLALVARGFTNKDIAETLYVSPNTVKTHVASLLHKLDAETRAQLAAIVTRLERGQRELV